MCLFRVMASEQVGCLVVILVSMAKAFVLGNAQIVSKFT